MRNIAGMTNLNIERIYGISNIFAIAFALVALVLSLLFNDVSLWTPVIILLTPTAVFCTVILSALIWSFFATRGMDNDNK